MKKSDIAMIILIASLSIVVAYFIAGAIPGLKETKDREKVATMQSISPSVGDLDTKVFNKDALNPTVRVVIGSNQAQPATPPTTTPVPASQ